MWEEENEYIIVNCSSYELASKVGIFGIIILIAWNFIYDGLILLVTQLPSDFSFSFFVTQVGSLSIVGGIFKSVGFVGIFYMKGKKIGILFPLMYLISRMYYSFYLYFSQEFGILSLNLYVLSTNILGPIFTIIGGLLIYSIRTRSEDPFSVSLFASVYTFLGLLDDGFWWLFYGLRFSLLIDPSLHYLVLQSSNTLIFLIVSLFTIKFFQQESRQGCWGDSEHRDTPFLE